ncbi:MAG: type IV pilus assembly protein PilM [Myxococcales bacterium]|nr:type IV pilus assembly protein PilM [Myxococcales bacterium]MCB9519319.1 type IV pilus assembly protein PilM [Myxococcales bacterium]MCB9530763.1 type IV pilus assembly protein PilM [Myxococcales bacterium]MCB9533343.1 type IV pilus assembly protein PilM [Myxococcales bacterium]
MAKGKNLLGLDIGATSVKCCLLKETKRGLQLQVFDSILLPDEAIVEGAVMNSGVIVDAIKELLGRNKIRQKEAALAVAGYSVIIKKITLPLMTREELDESIQWEAEQYIPFDIADVYVAVEMLTSRAAQGQMDVLLVAAKKETVNDYVHVAREAGLEPMVMDVQACDLQNMFEVNYGKTQGETVVLIDCGAAVTNINVLSDGVTTFTRDIAMAGNLFTEEIQKQLNITYEEAEAYKRGGSGEQADSVVPQEVERVVQQVAEAIAGEVQRSLDFYAATSAESLFSKVYLTGGSARLPALGRTISRTCGVPVELINPFANIAYDERTFTPEYLETVAPSAGVAVGLALRKTNEQP